MFRRDSEPAKPAASPAPRESVAASKQAALIAPGCKVIGKITGTADVIIEGELEGDVQLETMVHVGKEGRVKGGISARSVRVAGRIVGNVKGIERVEVMPSGQLEGDVIAPRVVISEGAFVKGKIEMVGTGKDPAVGKAST